MCKLYDMLKLYLLKTNQWHTFEGTDQYSIKINIKISRHVIISRIIIQMKIKNTYEFNSLDKNRKTSKFLTRPKKDNFYHKS